MNDKIESRNTSIEGRGLFAKRDIKKDELIAVFTGKTISTDEANKIYSTGYDYMLQINQDQFILLDSDLKFANHSCSPNCAFLESAKLYAVKDICMGDEITFDYSLNEDTPFEINCLCGNSSCRGKIGPYQDLPKDFKLTSRSTTTPYLKRKRVYIEQDKGVSFIKIESFKELIDISKVAYYEVSQKKINRLIGDTDEFIVKFYDKDNNLIKPY
jgi:hypothetical protein